MGHRSRSAVASGALALALVAVSAAAERAAEPSLDQVLDRVGGYVERYETALGSVVAYEEYVQELNGFRVVANSYRTPYRKRRKMRSAFLMLRVEEPDGSADWLGFRDVLEVDGQAIGDRDRRFEELFRPGVSMREEWRRFADESARFNIGFVERNINIPTLALVVARPASQGRFAFERKGRRSGRTNGVETWEVRFRETASPTLIHTNDGAEMALAGTLWVEPRSGRVVRTEIKTRPGDVGVNWKIRVDYGPARELEMWVPLEMSEEYRLTGRSGVISCRAKYTNFRRFGVETEMRVGD